MKKINASFSDLVSLSVSGNPKSKRKKNGKGASEKNQSNIDPGITEQSMKEKPAINDFLKNSNEALGKEVQYMQQHPLSREEKLAQEKRRMSGIYARKERDKKRGKA